MMKVDMVSFNIGVPGINDDVVLDVLGAGVANLIDEHKKLGLDFAEMTMQEHTRLTIGDHLSEHLGDTQPDLFRWTYDSVIDQLSVLMATYSLEMEEFAERVESINDISWLHYPGLIRIFVRENPLSVFGNSELQLPEC